MMMKLTANNHSTLPQIKTELYWIMGVTLIRQINLHTVLLFNIVISLQVLFHNGSLLHSKFNIQLLITHSTTLLEI
jgi:hypothetical protein